MAAKFEGIYEALRGDIEGEVYPYQAFLPSEYELCGRFSCARNTARRALAALAQQGYVQSIHGKGVRVLYRPEGQQSFSIGGIETFAETAKRNHFEGRTRVVGFRHLLADEAISKASGFPVGTPLVAIDRVRYLAGTPLILDKNLFRSDLVTGLTEEIAAKSIYAYLEQELHLRVVTSKRRMTVERATAEDRALLSLGDYDCLAVVRSQTFIADGTQIECTTSRHHPERFAFEDTAVRKV